MGEIQAKVIDNIPGRYGRTYEIFIPEVKIAMVNLSNFDKALLDDIKNGKKSNTPIADVILGLETLVRRIEEQSSTPNTKKEETK